MSHYQKYIQKQRGGDRRHDTRLYACRTFSILLTTLAEREHEATDVEIDDIFKTMQSALEDSFTNEESQLMEMRKKISPRFQDQFAAYFFTHGDKELKERQQGRDHIILKWWAHTDTPCDGYLWREILTLNLDHVFLSAHLLDVKIRRMIKNNDQEGLEIIAPKTSGCGVISMVAESPHFELFYPFQTSEDLLWGLYPLKDKEKTPQREACIHRLIDGINLSDFPEKDMDVEHSRLKNLYFSFLFVYPDIATKIATKFPSLSITTTDIFFNEWTRQKTSSLEQGIVLPDLTMTNFSFLINQAIFNPQTDEQQRFHFLCLLLDAYKTNPAFQEAIFYFLERGEIEHKSSPLAMKTFDLFLSTVSEDKLQDILIKRISNDTNSMVLFKQTVVELLRRNDTVFHKIWERIADKNKIHRSNEKFLNVFNEALKENIQQQLNTGVDCPTLHKKKM